MVMHARKIPRIDDGYPDKREAQSYQSSQYPSKASYSSNHSDRYDRHRSPGRGNSPSSRGSPRYINKSSYIERNKEKFDRGNTSSPGKKANHTYTGSSNHSNNGNHSGGQDRTPSRANSSATKDKAEVQKSAIRSCGDWSEHLSSTGKRYFYNIKSEVSQWERPREWTDSSSSRVERNSTDSRNSYEKQSTKDKLWSDSKNRHPSGPIEKREKHLGDLRHMVADGNPKPDKMYLFEKLQQSQSKLQAEMRANMSNKPLYSGDYKDMQRRDDRSPSDHPNSTSSSRRSRRDSGGSRMLARQTSRQDPDELESPGSTPTSHLSGGTPHQVGTGSSTVSGISTSNLNISSIPGLITQLSGGQNNQDLTNKALQTLQKLQEALSRQIAAHQTSVGTQSSTQSSHIPSSPRIHPTPHVEEPIVSNQFHHHHHHQHSSNLAPPQSLPHPAHRSPYVNSLQQQSHSHGGLPPPQSSPHPIITTAMTSPVSVTTGSTTTIPITHTAHPFPKGNTVYGKFLGSQNRNCIPNYPQLLEDKGGGEVKVTDGGGGSDRSSCCSPAPSDTSSQGAPVDPDMFNTSSTGQENNLMSTLSQYYNEKLVSHVTGWQGEFVEKQSRLYGEESLKIGSLISSQVSVELKRARSLVRVEEIHATLHEQRNLFLAQQISELENMKPVSSVSLFLPSSTSSSS